MNADDLSNISCKIASEGIEVYDKNFLKEIYNTDDLNQLFEEFDSLISRIKYKKQDITLIFYLGLFNLIDSSKFKLLSEVTQNSFDLLRGGLTKYFKGHLDITIESYEISFHGNFLARIDQWNEYKTLPMRPLFLLLRWIYHSQPELFFELLFEDESNIIFLTFVHGGIVENIDFDEKHINFDCTDEIKFYAIFYYFIKPFQYLQDSDEVLEKNLSIILNIPLNYLMQIILDFIRYPQMSNIPVKFINIIIENCDLLFKKFNIMEISNIYDLQSFLFLLHYGSSNFQKTLFNSILNKLEHLIGGRFIHIKTEDLKVFYGLLDRKQISEIILLLKRAQKDLIFVSEFDSQIRINEYITDTEKYAHLDNLILYSTSFEFY